MLSFHIFSAYSISALYNMSFWSVTVGFAPLCYNTNNKGVTAHHKVSVLLQTVKSELQFSTLKHSSFKP